MLAYSFVLMQSYLLVPFIIFEHSESKPFNLPVIHVSNDVLPELGISFSSIHLNCANTSAPQIVRHHSFH